MKADTGILTALLGVALLAACTRESLQSTYDKQATYIDNFITSTLQSDTNATLTRNGGACRINLHDTLDAGRDSLRPGGKAALYYGCFLLTGATVSTSNLVATNLRELADAAKWELSDTTIYKLDTIVLDKSLVPGLMDGLAGVQPLDEGYILFTGQHGFGNVQRGTIPARSALAYYFWIENISNE